VKRHYRDKIPYCIKLKRLSGHEKKELAALPEVQQNTVQSALSREAPS
jgi:hypothetical protein